MTQQSQPRKTLLLRCKIKHLLRRKEAAPTQTDAQNTDQATLPEISVDTVRIDADGYVLVAGKGDAGLDIAAVVDGVEVARTNVENDGKFCF